MARRKLQIKPVVDSNHTLYDVLECSTDGASKVLWHAARVRCSRPGELLNLVIVDGTLSVAERAAVEQALNRRPLEARHRSGPVSGGSSSRRPVKFLPIAITVLAFSSIAFVVKEGLRSIDTSHQEPVRVPPTNTPEQPSTQNEAPPTKNATSIPRSSDTGEVVSGDSSDWRRRKHDIVEAAATKSEDPELSQEYRQINEQYFQNELPVIPVIWEPRLAEVGPLIANDMTLRGVTNGRLILLNDTIRGKRDETTATLCHEMVHVYFAVLGQKDEKHGPAFQGVLRRLSEQGAFKAVWASDAEKKALRSWIAHESDRLDAEFSVLDDLSKDIDRQQDRHDMEVTDLNDRIDDANQKGHGWPTGDEIDTVKAEGSLLSQYVADFNDRVDRVNADVRQFNLEARRYNLMMAYPDGLDEESVVRRKQVLPSVSSNKNL